MIYYFVGIVSRKISYWRGGARRVGNDWCCPKESVQTQIVFTMPEGINDRGERAVSYERTG